jgi:hypothetical protein
MSGFGLAACTTWGMNADYGWTENNFTTGGTTSAYREQQLGGSLYMAGDYWGQSVGFFTGEAALEPSPTSEIMGLSYGLNLRIPIKLGPLYLFPMIGTDWAFYLDHPVTHSFTESAGGPEAVAHNSFGLQAGGGLDFWLLDSFYIRAMALYNLCLPNIFELGFEDAQAGNSTSRRMGPSFQLGLGGVLDSDGRNSNSIGGMARRAVERGRIAAAQARWDSQDDFNLERVKAGAELIGVNVPWVQKTLDASTTDVWFRMESAIGDNLAFETEGSTDTYLELYDAKLGTMLGSDDNSGTDNNARLIFNVAANTNYLIRIRGKRNASAGTVATGRFRFHIIKYQAPVTPAPTQTQTPRTVTANQDGLTEMTLNTIYNNTFSASTPIHGYRLDVPAGYQSVTIYTEGSLDIRISAVTAVGMLTALAGNVDDLAPQDRLGYDDDSGTGFNAQLTTTVPEDRSIYYVVGLYDDANTGSYTITTQGSR